MAQNKVSCIDIVFGDQKIPFIGGPCVIESRDHSLKMAEEILKITDGRVHHQLVDIVAKTSVQIHTRLAYKKFLQTKD
jgi:3-deoxy-D-manno-octulosonic acid (KDO) 8-phosphate synthase